MKQKKGPIIFIAVLAVVLVFILGFSYGKTIESENKAIAYLLSITPSLPTSKTPFNNYLSLKHTGCEVDFLYPSYLNIKKESSNEAALESDDSSQFVRLNCSISKTTIPNGSSESIEISNQPGTKNIIKDLSILTIKHPKTEKYITASMSAGLSPLIEKSFEFSSE